MRRLKNCRGATKSSWFLYRRKKNCFRARQRVERQQTIARRRLRSAARLLIPIGGNHVVQSTVSLDDSPTSRSGISLSRQRDLATMANVLPPAAGIAAGAAATAGLWGAVQVGAHASTGAAMLGLHGAAASSAGWAWFGGGSLATGGAGMVVGHFVLPGIGTAIAVGTCSIISHMQANDLGRRCEEIEVAHRWNLRVCEDISINLDRFNELELKLGAETASLGAAVGAAKRRLFRFGWLSHLRRLFRYWMGGDYYETTDFNDLDRLGEAVERFYETFAKAQ
jgi:hypothetical protein